jgi:hypothetical protein
VLGDCRIPGRTQSPEERGGFQGLRRPLEQWKVRVWQRPQRLKPAVMASPAQALSLLPSLMTLASAM